MLIFLDESQARAGWATDLQKVNPPAIVGKSKVTSYFYEVIEWSKTSKTAQAILSIVQNSPTQIYVLGMKGGGFSCFNSDYPEKGVGTVYYNLTLEMAIGFTTTGPHDTASKMKLDWDKDHARHPRLKETVGMRVDQKAPVALHNYIGFLHELGHAKQFIENPLFFEGAHTNTSKFTGEIEAAARDRKGFWTKVQSDEHRAELRAAAPKGIRPWVSPEIPAASGRKPKLVLDNPSAGSSPIPPGSRPTGGPPGPPGPPAAPGPPPPMRMLTAAEKEAERLKKDIYRLHQHKPVPIDGWGVRIETDNLIRHEWPICDEMGYPKRNYNDLIVR